MTSHLHLLAAISYDPLVRIRLGPLAVSPHGVATALAFLVGTAVMLPAARRRGISEEVVYGVVTRSLIGGILGARFFYVVNNFSSFDSPLEWIAVWEGGISLLGGIVGAILANLGYVRGHGHRFFQVMDAAAPALVLGIAIGRVATSSSPTTSVPPRPSPSAFGAQRWSTSGERWVRAVRPGSWCTSRPCTT